MAKNTVDLTSKEWRDIVFANKNKEFGAYQLRKSSDKRHNMATLFALAGLVVVAIMIFAWSEYQDYQAEKEREAKELAEKMSAADLVVEETPEETDEPEEQKFEQEIPEVPEEVLATVQVTQIAIVDADKVKNEILTQEQQQEDNTARGVVNQAGQDDVDKFQSVKEQVIVKPEPIVEKPKPKDDEIFVAVEQPAMFPGGPSALNKWLSSHLNYPAQAVQDDIQGRVIVKFVVGKDGSVSQVQVVKGVDRNLDREAVRVVKSMPKWQPGKNNGQPVNSWYTVPVVFKLQK